jgi:hypothetical protein
MYYLDKDDLVLIHYLDTYYIALSSLLVLNVNYDHVI